MCSAKDSLEGLRLVGVLFAFIWDGFASSSDFLSPLTWQIAVVARIQLTWIAACRQNSVPCMSCLVDHGLTICKIWLILNQVIKLLDILIEWRNLLRLNAVLTRSSGSRFAFTWRVLQVLSVRVTTLSGA